MRVLICLRPPMADKLQRRLRSKAIGALRSSGHEVDDLDLYAEKFNPVLSPQMFRDYTDVNANTREVKRLCAATPGRRGARTCLPGFVRRPSSNLAGLFSRSFLFRAQRLSTTRVCVCVCTGRRLCHPPGRAMKSNRAVAPATCMWIEELVDLSSDGPRAAQVHLGQMSAVGARGRGRWTTWSSC